MTVEDVRHALAPSFDPHAAYFEGLSSVNEPMRSILEKYSQVKPDEALAHVKDVRDRAYAVYPYPCVAQFMFLNLAFCTLPCFDAVLERVKNGQKFLDMGCAFGQELRQLVYHGAPSERLYGVDLRMDFLNLGYDLFRDRATLKSRFFASNLLDESSEAVVQLKEEIDIIFASLFFHVFTWDQQITIAKHALQMLTPKPGSMIVGRNAAYIKRTTQDSTVSFHHDVESWRSLWDRVRNDTGKKFRVETWKQADDSFKDHPHMGAYMMYFSVTLE